MLWRMRYPALILGSFLALAACESGDVRDTLGLDRAAPDEFKVVSRPPLSVPPEFDLRPPEPGAPPRAAPSTEKSAKSLVLQDGSMTTTDLDSYQPASETAVDPVVEGSLSSSAESVFLGRAGVDKADPEIRSKLHKDRKADPVVKEDVSPLEELMGVDPGDPVVDAKAETKRIKKNKKEGKPVTAGKVKTVDPHKGSVLDKIF